MVDDWSLKDKERIFPMDFISYSLIQQKTFYLPEDIDVLRQKIIEDFEFVFCNQESKYRNNKYKEIILSIINKRFGVDTD